MHNCAEAGDGAIARVIKRAVADLEAVRSEGVALCREQGWSSTAS
jgi:hypothetical protein